MSRSSVDSTLAPVVVAAHLIVQRKDRCNFRFACSACLASRMFFEERNQFQHVLRILGCHDLHYGATPWKQLDQGFCGEHLEGFAQGGTRNADVQSR